MTLSENERESLFDMLEPHMEKFDFEDFISEEIETGFSDKQLTDFLIKALFSKHKKALNS